MNDENKTRPQLIEELTELRQEVARLQDAARGREWGLTYDRDFPPEYEDLRPGRPDTLISQFPGDITALANVSGTNFPRRNNDGLAGTLLDSSSDAILLLNKQRKIISCNKAFLELFGYERHEVEGKSTKIIHTSEEHFSAFGKMAYPKIIRHGSYRGEYEFVQKDGVVFPAETVTSAIKNQDGATDAYISIIRDMKERARIENELRESEERYRNLVENITETVFSFDSQGQFSYISPVIEKIGGYKPEEVIGEHFTRFIHPEDLSSTQKEFLNALEGKSSPIEFRAFTKDQSIKHIRTSTRPVYENGRISGLTGVFNDVSEQKQAEENIRYRLRFEQLITDLATQFINLPTDKIDAGINHSLESIGKFAGVDRNYVFSISEDGEVLSCQYEWCADGIEPQIDNLRSVPGNSVPYFMEFMNRYETFYAPRVADLPPEAQREKDIFQKEDIQSLICVPMVHRDSLVGFVGFDSVREEKRWPEESIALLKIMGEIFINALERKRSEEQLLESERRYRTIFETTGTATVIAEEDATASLINAEFEKLTGYSKEEIEGKKKGPEFIDKRDLNKVNRYWQLRELGPTKAPKSYEVRIVDKNGAVKNTIITVSLIPGTTSRVASLLDVTSLKQTEQELRDSQQELAVRNRIAQLLLTSPDENMYDGVLNAVLDVLHSKYGYFGYIDDDGSLVCPSITRNVLSKHREESESVILPPETWDGIWGESLKEKKTLLCNKSVKASKGHVPLNRTLVVPIIQKGELIGQFGVADKDVDYGEKDRQLLQAIAAYIAPVLHARLDKVRKEQESLKAHEENVKLQSQLRQAQRMQAIGTLAGGIAHDFNNILAAITGFTEIALYFELPEDSRARHSLNQVLKASQRAKDLIQQILTFSRQKEGERKFVKVTPIIKEALKFLRASIPTSIEIRQTLNATWDTALCGPSHIHQVLMNLCTNAAHAMREGGGTLAVSLTDVELSAQDVSRYPDLRPGPYLKLKVCDTGVGMERSTLEHIFEPYFTSKPRGEGTGLGLAVVHGIVKSLGGMITVESEPGKGSDFTVLIPRAEQGVEEEDAECGAAPTGTEHILLVDDEEALVTMGREMLERLGYKVTTRTSSVEALEAFRAHPERFDLVISDVTMPNMTGDQLAHELLIIKSDIPILLCTGFSELLDEEKAKRLGIKAFLMKPFVMGNLATVIRNALSGGDKSPDDTLH